MSNGKGDKARNCHTEAFRANYDSIFRKEEKTMKNDKQPTPAEIDALLNEMYAISDPIKGPITVTWDKDDCFTSWDGDGRMIMTGSRAAYDAMSKAFGKEPS